MRSTSVLSLNPARGGIWSISTSLGWSGIPRLSQSGPLIAQMVPLRRIISSTVVFWPAIGALSSRYERLLLGEQRGKDIFSPLSELESVVGIQDQRLYERLGLLATRFPDGFEG